jgi:hypothetical protein
MFAVDRRSVERMEVGRRNLNDGRRRLDGRRFEGTSGGAPKCLCDSKA